MIDWLVGEVIGWFSGCGLVQLHGAIPDEKTVYKESQSKSNSTQRDTQANTQTSFDDWYSDSQTNIENI